MRKFPLRVNILLMAKLLILLGFLVFSCSRDAGKGITNKSAVISPRIPDTTNAQATSSAVEPSIEKQQLIPMVNPGRDRQILAIMNSGLGY